MIEWKECTLSDLGDIVGGATPSTKEDSNYGGDIAWITPKDLSYLRGRFITYGERNITKRGLDSCSTRIMPANTVLFSSRAPIGYIAIAKNELCTNQGFKSVVPNPNCDPMFLYYLLQYNRERIKSIGTGTTFKEISGTTMRGIQVRVPIHKKDQQRISCILDTIDRKIECNDCINKNLQQQGETLFRDYFLDKYPISGWGYGTFSDIIESTSTGDWGKEMPEGNYSVNVFCIRGADIPAIRIGDMGKMPSRYISPKNYITKKLVPDNVVIEISGGSPTQSTGRAALITQALLARYPQDMICSNFCKAVKLKAEYSIFFYLYWQYLYEVGAFFRYENGTTGIKNLDFNRFVEGEEILIPPSAYVEQFNSIYRSITNKIYANSHENAQLAELRDTLLPKLLSGEIDVSNISLDI